MKKILSLVLSAVMIFTMASTALAAFPDVDENYSWAQEAIEELSEKSIITGYEDGSFQPGKSVTRQESIALFSKSLGASEEMNASIVNLAYGIYGAELAECTDSYAVKQGAYMVYRKVLTPEEVVDYLNGDNRNLELKRYEAATLIAKALGADVWLKTNKNFEVTFADKDEIPAMALGYVYYATELGIMNGMGDDMFGPKETVTRAQIAVMIKRILDMMNFEYINGMISEVDTLHNNLAIKSEDGSIAKFGVGNSGAIYLDGNKVTLTELNAGMECVFTFSNDSLYQIDAITYEGEETVYGAYKGKTTNNSGTTIKLDDVTTAETDLTSYKLASNAVVTFEGEPSTLAELTLGDYVEIKISGGLAVAVNVESKTKTVSGLTITDIQTSGEGVMLYVTNDEEETFIYELASNASFIRNSAKATYDELAIGDSVTLTFTYRLVTGVTAIGKEKSTEGLIEEITISNNTSYITITSGGSKAKYAMARDCEILLQDEEATAYDLRLGAYVKLTVSSETVTKIASEAVSEALSLTGTIKTVNTSYGLVVITYENAYGTTVEKQLFINDTTKILNSKTGKLLTKKDLKVGNIITAAGTEKLGVYEVTSVMILQ